MKRAFAAILVSGMALLAGCKSAYVEASVQNNTGAAITLLEVDYPSASFGKEELAAGATFRYRFKILGNGATKVMWTDESRKEHTVAGPELKEGQEGSLTIVLQPAAAEWQPHLKPDSVQ